MDLRKTKIEIIEGKTVKVEIASSGDARFDVRERSQYETVLSASRPTLIFNRDYGSYGYITGEIAFKFRNSSDAVNFPEWEFPGVKKLGRLEIYTVQARSTDEFAAYVRKLSARNDLAWVEPAVTYFSGSPAEGLVRQ